MAQENQMITNGIPGRIDNRDWTALSRGEQIRMIEELGYLIVPDMLSPDYLSALKFETENWKQSDAITTSVSEVAAMRI